MIKKLFYNESIFGNKISISIVLGPIFLLFSLSLTLFGYNLPNIDLWIIVVMGIVFLWQFHRKGMMLILFSLLLSSFIKHIVISSNHLWQLGLEMSVAFGLYITYMGFEQIFSVVLAFEKNKEKLITDMSQIEEEFSKEEAMYLQKNRKLQELLDKVNIEIEEKEGKISSLNSLLSTIKSDYEQDKFERNALIEENLDKTRLIEKLTNEKPIVSNEYKKDYKDLLNELNQARMKKLQSHYINETLLRMLHRAKEENNPSAIISSLKEKISFLENKIKEVENAKPRVQVVEKTPEKSISNKDQLIKKYEKKLSEYKQLEFAFKQLKQQFIEKDEKLHEVRKISFSLQEKLLSKEREELLEEYSLSNEEENLINHIISLEKEIQNLEKENENLEKIIFSLDS